MSACTRRKPPRPSLVERIEFEYIRHGTLSLIANLDVVTGKVVSPSIGPTRSEADFAAHIDRTIDNDPAAEWIFIADQLDTHQSATLVELVARRCVIEEDLGIKGKKRCFEIEKDAQGVPRGFVPSNSLRLHASPLLLAQSSRALVLNSGAPSLEEIELQVDRCATIGRARVHRVFQ